LADVTADLLREAGYDVVVAIDGKAGLASLATRSTDIAIIDLTMPVIDGIEMIRRMKADPALATIPVIAMTAMPNPRPVPLADATLRKPFSFGTLLETIERVSKRP
jgi:CheY-like chemotaxis protein